MTDIKHPAGLHSVAGMLTTAVQARIPGWEQKADRTTWYATEPEQDHGRPRWVIIATGQLAMHDAIGNRPGPLIIAGARGIETRIQLPWVTGSDDRQAVLNALVALGVLPQLCCKLHDADDERCAPDDQGGYCCMECPTLIADIRKADTADIEQRA